MMQQSRWQHGSSGGELDVFGATSYFAAAGLQAAESKVMRHVTRMEDDDEQLGLHDDERHDHQLMGDGVLGKPSGKTKLAALLMSFVVSQSPRASFRKESPPPPPPTTKQLLAAAAGDEPVVKAASPASSASSHRSTSMQLQGCGGGVHDEVDLGVAVGDRRLLGVRVVRGHEERWVVRCSAWEEHHERMMLDDDAGSSSSDPNKDDEADDEEGDDDGNNNPGDWESDCSSDLFDLDLEYICR